MTHSTVTLEIQMMDVKTMRDLAGYWISPGVVQVQG